ncbi:hypothetical protein IV203_004127 [Nitzschia inconspicua]|uniref:Uncharacterized protein n=1 Tax=Nitzschia inconspicua TaxID=303405 RepID=A0A9K3L4Q8_9STRA|nr:hypothetical protein IV203_004127 [Nitzschia inconspicua]
MGGERSKWNFFNLGGSHCYYQELRSTGEDDGFRWQRAGVYIEFAKEAIFSFVISNEIDQDGFFFYDVPLLRMSEVDAIANGNDGIQIQRYKGNSSPAMINEVEFLRVQACSNGNDGIELVSRKGRQIQSSPVSQVVFCENQEFDIVVRGGSEAVMVSHPSTLEIAEPLGFMADSCSMYPGEESCRSKTFLSCTADVCLPRGPVIPNHDGKDI